MPRRNTYEVIVGNIGTVHTGHNKITALTIYNSYVRRSQQGLGRGGDEQVTFMVNGEPDQEYIPRSPRPAPQQDPVEVLSPNGVVKVQVEYIGEGLDGDYDPKNPEDEPLLRFSIHRRYEKGEAVVSGFLGDYDTISKWNEKPEYLYVRDSSYCCPIRADSPKANWDKLARYVLAHVQADVMDQRHAKREYERLSWVDQKTLDAWVG